MKKLCKFNLFAALTLCLSMAACTVNGDDNGNNGTNTSTNTNSGSNTNTNNGTNTNTNNNNTNNSTSQGGFSIKYSDVYILAYVGGEAADDYCLDAIYLDVGVKNDEVESYPYNMVSVYVCASKLSGDIDLPNDPNADNYALYGSYQSKNSKGVTYLSNGGKISISKAQNKDLTAQLKNVSFKGYDCYEDEENETYICEYTNTNGPISLDNLDISTTNALYVDCFDLWEKYYDEDADWTDDDEDQYCACFEDDCE